jgi:SAM-dependent methyltransferase
VSRRRFPDSERAKAFGAVADAYDQGRPSYPERAIVWLLGKRRRTVLDLAAGTGKLTGVLLEAGHDVLAVEPDRTMLAVLAARYPAAFAVAGPAESIPLAAASADAVLVGQAWHWFDPDRAATEARRVLRPDGFVAMLYNVRDEREPWVARFAAATGEHATASTPPFPGVEGSPDFGPIETREFAHEQEMTPGDVVSLAASISSVALQPAAARHAILREIEAIAHDTAPAGGTLRLPYRLFVARAYRR